VSSSTAASSTGATNEERTFWSQRLLQSGDVRGTVEAFLKSPEYAGKNKNDREAITDLYQAFFNRTRRGGDPELGAADRPR